MQDIETLEAAGDEVVHWLLRDLAGFAPHAGLPVLVAAAGPDSKFAASETQVLDLARGAAFLLVTNDFGARPRRP
jgi:hypothetical protein